MPRVCVKGQSPSQGAVRGPLAVGTVFEALRPWFWELGQIFIPYTYSAIQQRPHIKTSITHTEAARISLTNALLHGSN